MARWQQNPSIYTCPLRDPVVSKNRDAGLMSTVFLTASAARSIIPAHLQLVLLSRTRIVFGMSGRASGAGGGRSRGRGRRSRGDRPDGASDQECRIDAEDLHEETSGGVEHHVQHKDVAGFQPLREAAGHPEQNQAHEYVP